MQIKVSRTYFYIAACFCVWFFWLINRVTVIHDGNFAQGTVKETRCQKGRNPYCYPQIAFQYQGNVFLFEAEADLDLRKDDEVTVLHNSKNPTQAWVWSFGGFWSVSIIVALLCTLLINALVYSFVRKRQYFLITLPFFKEKNNLSTDNYHNQYIDTNANPPKLS